MSFRKGLAGADGPLRVLLCVERELYRLLHGGTSLGVNMAEMAGMAGMAEKSGKSGKILFLLLLFLRCCISFFVHRVDFRYWQPLRDSRTRQTRAGQPATGRAGRRVWTLQVGKCRVGAGISCFFPDFCAGLRTLILAVFVVCRADRLWAANSLAGAVFRSQIPCRGSHGMTMTVFSQYGPFTFGHGFIVSLFSMFLP